MSRPWPVLATTEAFGWMSSKDSLVTATSTPVAALKASIIFTKASSSACTKRRQRIRLILAPFSGFHGAACAQALAQSSSARPESAAGGRERGAALDHGAAGKVSHRIPPYVVFF